MSSSVSSERAFSQGGITITKLRSCLKGDIVEALLCLKCAIKNDILMQEPTPSSTLEQKIGKQGADGDNDTEDYSWDELVVEDEGDDAMFDWDELVVEADSDDAMSDSD
jgi:hypothetical protein